MTLQISGLQKVFHAFDKAIALISPAPAALKVLAASFKVNHVVKISSNKIMFLPLK